MQRTIPVRWRVLFVLFVVSFVNYFLRNALSVAAPSIQDEFSFSNQEIGWILDAFNLSYTLLHDSGRRLRPERTARGARSAVIAIAWGVLTWLTGFAPGLMAASATGAMVSLVVGAPARSARRTRRSSRSRPA